MCGIIAISGEKGAGLDPGPGMRAIKHRGPDDEGVFRSGGCDCLIGQVRLSILDLSQAGHQPMTDASGRFCLVYNGEVYNYRELQAGLQARHGDIQWKSATDTEVILEGFAREGAPFLKSLNGIFAIAIYDKSEKVLHVLRDPLGIKPLFATEQLGSVFFCSELKGLLAFPDLKRTLRMSALSDQLAFMYVPEPHTMFKEFVKVPPGVLQSYRSGRKISELEIFGALRSDLDLSRSEDAAEQIRTTLSASVRRQLMSDVPVSIFLSGGLDSSAVAREVVECGGNVKDAYTISFSDADRRYDQQGEDLPYAKMMAKKLGLRLHVIEAKQDFITLLPRLMSYMEDGFTDPSAINTYIIAEGARKTGVKVMLSGQGADEYLGGYRRYQAEKMLRRMPQLLRAGLSGIARISPAVLPGKFNAFSRRFSRLGKLAGQSCTARLLSMYTWTSPEEIRALLRVPEWGGERDFEALFNKYDGGDIVDTMLKVDQKYDLMSLNLCYTDRLSMAVGVEVRVPFMDLEMVRVMNAIPSGLKVSGGQGKYILKKAMEPLLPREIVYREKVGFGLPIRAWLRANNRLLEEYLSPERIKKQGIFDHGAVTDILSAQINGKGDHANTVFTLLCQQLWLESNLI